MAFLHDTIWNNGLLWHIATLGPFEDFCWFQEFITLHPLTPSPLLLQCLTGTHFSCFSSPLEDHVSCWFYSSLLSSSPTGKAKGAMQQAVLVTSTLAILEFEKRRKQEKLTNIVKILSFLYSIVKSLSIQPSQKRMRGCCSATCVRLSRWSGADFYPFQSSKPWSQPASYLSVYQEFHLLNAAASKNKLRPRKIEKNDYVQFEEQRSIVRIQPFLHAEKFIGYSSKKKSRITNGYFKSSLSSHSNPWDT